MKIVNIIGGLGNQMFQYAFAFVLQKRFPSEKILIDTSHFNYIFIKKFRGANLHNGFEIENIFSNAKLRHASAWNLMRVTWYMPNYILSRIIRRILPKRTTEYIQSRKQIFSYNPNLLKMDDVNKYYEGVFEAGQYYIPYRNELMKVFRHPVPNDKNKEIIGRLEQENSIGIHVRRGDYIYEPAFNGICDFDYYKRSIQFFLNKEKTCSFYIFSNDIKWCKENLVPLLKGNSMTFVTHNTGKKSCWDMFLMTHCKGLIIANSSFSWWGAFLNPKGIIVAPKTWVNRDCKIDIWLDDWIKV